MKHIRLSLIALLGMMVLSAHAQILSRGVTKELAEHRKANISNVIYDLTFNIPEGHGYCRHLLRREEG